MVIPVVFSALGAMSEKLPGWLAQMPETISKVAELQKSAFLRPAQILRCVLRLPGLW